ncbi:MAG: hypothetical protein LC659_09840 [Myxococcales bacterium]|nr:hypothetical protein [Myxococcales bacterium]
MSPESLLAEKLAAYRSTFDDACRGLFDSGEGVTLEYEQDDDDDAVAVPPAAAVSERAFENSNGGSDFAKKIRAAVRSIAEDFAREFNAKLALAVHHDPTVELVADKYEMGPDHVAELDTLLARPLAPLLSKLSTGDLDGARRATLDAWPLLERTIRSKWQAYFILTFQDVSVERKAARDRKRLQPRFDESAMNALADAQSKRHAMADFAAPADERRRGASPWIAVLALLLLAAAGGWILMHHHVH